MCNTHTWVGSLPDVLHSLARPRQGFWAVGHWTLNNTLNDIVLTSGYAEDLEKVCMEVWG